MNEPVSDEQLTADPVRFQPTPGVHYAPATAETHTSVLFFLGDRVFKLKKCVDLGFVDLSTLERRHTICEREVRLNRRLSPDVYLGVAAVSGPDGATCDHLVVMRRMPVERRLSTLVTANEGNHDADEMIDVITARLVDFHRAAERSPAADRTADVAALGGRWQADIEALRGFLGRPFTENAIAEIERLVTRYLHGRAPLFGARIAAGRACDGHGDLLADDIYYLDDGPRFLDCLEFDDALRLDDVLSDIAFLAMDLEHLGRADLARRLLDRYRDLSADDWPESLAHHYIAHRAVIRAKVAAIRAEQGDPGSTATALSLLQLAHQHLQYGRVRLIIVGGLPGTGKSTLARGLAVATGATLLRSDVLRKELAGLSETERSAAGYGAGIYSAEFTQRVYDELLDRAAGLLAGGHSVILDASWSSEAPRRAARDLARRTASDLVELSCDAPEDIVANRIAERLTRDDDASDADMSVHRMMAGSADPWPEAVAIATVGPPAQVTLSALEAIDWPDTGNRPDQPR